jgi:ketosteroid isomerase-like protein
MPNTRQTEVVKRFYDAQKHLDLHAVAETLTEDVVLQGSSDVSSALMPLTHQENRDGNYCGIDAITAFIASLANAFDFEQTDFKEFSESEDKVHVSAHSRYRIKQTGNICENDWTAEFTLRDGKISSIKAFDDSSVVVRYLLRG